MRKYLALATAAALAATVSYTLAQAPTTGQPGTDKGTTSTNPEMDKKGGKTKAGGSGADTTPTPPGSDRPAGEESTTSAKPNPDKKQKQ